MARSPSRNNLEAGAEAPTPAPPYDDGRKAYAHQE